jgi:HEPN domain-containing protein
MPERSKDWLRQGDSDLQHARNSKSVRDYDWAAFASHQAIANAEAIVEFCRSKID